MFVYSYFTVLFLGNHFVTLLLCFYVKLSFGLVVTSAIVEQGMWDTILELRKALLSFSEYTVMHYSKKRGYK